MVISVLLLLLFCLTYSTNILPTGGVILPIHKLNISIIPNWIGSIPKFLAVGKNIGVNINIAGVKSINVPTINNIKFIISNITTGLEDIPNNNSVVALGKFVNAITQDIIGDTPIKNTIIPVISTVSNNILGISFTYIYLSV